MDKRQVKLWLFLILLIACFLRFFALNLWPISLNPNEAILGYRAFSLATAGRDEFGQTHPLIFSSRMDYQLPLPTYFLIPFVKIFGLSELGVRLPFALLGVGTVLLIFFLAKNLFGPKVALWAAFFMAASPWAVFFSRFVSDEILVLFLFLFALWFFVLLF